MKLGGKEQIEVGAQNVWINREGYECVRWTGCNKVQGVGGDHASLFNLWQAAAEMGGATRRCYPADSLIQPCI